jgi:1-aminocyclopropane-1-carboxylate deaminase
LNFDSCADLSKGILQKIEFPEKIPVDVYIKRIDLVHPYISGNKWFKQKYNLIKAHQDEYDTLVSFGGAYSNHIHALAAAGKEFGFKTIGLIRGEEHLPLNQTLKFVTDQGMEIHYVSRSDYRRKHLPEYEKWIHEKFGRVYIVPEGGTNLLAVKGCSEIPELIEIDYDYLCTPCGTGGTISGLICGNDDRKKVLGFAVLKGARFLIDNAKLFSQEYSGKELSNWSINLDYHFGGYAKITSELISFIIQFEKINGVPLDPVYTGKMMYGIFDLAENGFFKDGERIVALHTGGLQGRDGMIDKIKTLL